MPSHCAVRFPIASEDAAIQRSVTVSAPCKRETPLLWDRGLRNSRNSLRSVTMRNEREKMLAGDLYDALEPELVAARNRARDLCQMRNATREGDQEIRRSICAQLFGKGGQTVWMQPPFYCDYGANIEM